MSRLLEHGGVVRIGKLPSGDPIEHVIGPRADQLGDPQTIYAAAERVFPEDASFIRKRLEEQFWNHVANSRMVVTVLPTHKHEPDSDRYIYSGVGRKVLA